MSAPPRPPLSPNGMRRGGRESSAADVTAPTTPATAPRSSPSDFTALMQQAHGLGLLRRRYGYYWTRLVGAVVAVAAWVAGFIRLGDSWWQLGMAVVLAVIMTQIAFLGHDAAHRQMFRSAGWNDWVSLVLANLLVGISYGWWRAKHNRHHANPNKDGADPDIAPGGLVLTPEPPDHPRGAVLRWLVAHQGWYFFPLTLLEGFSLHWEGIRGVASRSDDPRRWVEAVMLTVRLGGLGSLAFVVLPPGKAALFLTVQIAVFGMYLGCAFAPNHIGMPLVPATLKLDFLRRQVLVSRNITGGRLVSFLMGGLNHQIEHHLFPSIARPHLRTIAPLVAAHCAAQRIPYTQSTLRAAYRDVVRHLNQVGLAGNDPFLCPLVAQRRSIDPR